MLLLICFMQLSRWVSSRTENEDRLTSVEVHQALMELFVFYLIKLPHVPETLREILKQAQEKINEAYDEEPFSVSTRICKLQSVRLRINFVDLTLTDCLYNINFIATIVGPTYKSQIYTIGQYFEGKKLSH